MGMDAFDLSKEEAGELAPEGILRAAIAVGPAGSAVWATRDELTAEPKGVTVSLAREISRRTGLSLELVPFSSSGDIVANVNEGSWTISFVPIDAERRKHLAVGPNYYLGVSTYLVREGEFASVDDVDKSTARVVGIEGTATFRSAERTLKRASIVPIKSLDRAVAMFRAGEVDAVALGKESIVSLLRTIGGAAATTGHFHEAGTAVVVPPGRSAAFEAATRMIDALKADGTIRVIFDANNMAEAEVAP